MLNQKLADNRRVSENDLHWPEVLPPSMQWIFLDTPHLSSTVTWLIT